MRRVLLIGCAALFISIAGLAQTPSPAPLSQEALAVILGQPAVAGEPTSPQTQEPALAAAKSPLPEKASCTATANCPFGVRVTCSGTTSCSSKDGTSCSAEGHVTCNGVTKSCDTCYVGCRCAGFSDAFCRANC
ncbi:MAG TPA: hypothetical protein VGM86_34120 [Thermoanaerobaculia bacterium]